MGRLPAQLHLPALQPVKEVPAVRRLLLLLLHLTELLLQGRQLLLAAGRLSYAPDGLFDPLLPLRVGHVLVENDPPAR